MAQAIGSAEKSEGRDMRKTLLGALMALTITAANAAVEDTNSADFMLPFCRLTAKEISADVNKAANYGRCLGIVEGISQMFSLLKEAQAAGAARLDPLLCTSIPADLSNAQLVSVVVKYGEAFPELTHRPFSVLAMSAMQLAWPCNK
jgi:Rap1a immunity proteins